MKLRRERDGLAHYCPGCETLHYIAVDDADGCNWYFDGDMEAPTFAPAVKHVQPGKDQGICHYHIQNGVITFGTDSTHKYSGQSTPLPDIPEGSDVS
jgi:hypothetical protein